MCRAEKKQNARRRRLWLYQCRLWNETQYVTEKSSASIQCALAMSVSWFKVQREMHKPSTLTRTYIHRNHNVHWT